MGRSSGGWKSAGSAETRLEVALLPHDAGQYPDANESFAVHAFRLSQPVVKSWDCIGGLHGGPLVYRILAFCHGRYGQHMAMSALWDSSTSNSQHVVPHVLMLIVVKSLEKLIRTLRRV